MSQYDASGVKTSGTGNLPLAVRRTAGTGRPIGRAQPLYSLQRTRVEPGHLGAPMTTMTASVGQVKPSAGPPRRKVVHYFLGKGDSDQLQTCENAWVPSCLKTKSADNSQPLSDGNVQIEETRKKFTSILNKISPENMVLLTDQIVALPIDTEQCLNKAIELLFQKAINEPHFTPQYAYICTEMHKRETKRDVNKQSTSFKKLLTMCCQERFSKMHAHEEALAKNLRDIDVCNDQDVKEQMQSRYNQDEIVYRKKSVGNCRFMCELYKVGILTRQTLEMSIKHLLKSPSEETLECVCNILKHTGSTLSHKASFKKLSEYASASYKSKIPTRIRFMIQDTIELKENNWVPRNARPKVQICNTRASTYTKNPVQYVPLAPNALSTKKSELSVEIRKVEVGHNNKSAIATVIDDPKKPLLPLSVSDVVKSRAPLVSPCVGLVTESTNNCHSSDDEILKKCQTILDNLSPENIVPMAKSVLSLPIKTDTCLKEIVGLVFEKAMSEPALTPLYAHFCSLTKNKGVCSENQNTSTTFRTLLIGMCQNAFESMYTRKGLVAKDRKEIESYKDKDTRKKLQSKFDQNELDYRKRSVANCRFMCELLKVNIMVPSILEMCAERLVETLKETSLECLYVIVKHAGTELNHCDIFERLHEYLTADKQKLSSRVRSAIQDTLELENSDLALRNTFDKRPLLNDTEEDALAQSPIEDMIKQPSADVQPAVSTVRESTPPEKNNEIEKEQMKHQTLTDKHKLNVYKTVKSVINSVTAENMNSKINELSALITNIDMMEKTVDFIFARANNRPENIPELVCICSSLKNIVASPVEEHSKPISFKKQILICCDRVLKSGVQNDSSGNGFTCKEHYTFIGELFNANVLSAHTVLEFLQIIPVKLTNRGLDNTCCLLKAAGKKLQRVHNLKKTIRKLTNMVSSDVEGLYSRRSSMNLEELVEQYDKKWIK